MGHAVESNASLLIVSDSKADATLVKSQLDDEFGRIRIGVDPETAVDEIQRERPDILVLAFRELARSEQFYLRLFRLAAQAHTPTHRAIVLCTQQQLGLAYELCRRDLFDDYVIFWPYTHDVTRLPMSIHRAIKELAVLPDTAQVVASTGEVGRSLDSNTTPLAQLGSTTQGHTVLVVDDDEQCRELVGRVLESEGLNVHYAASAEQALNLLHSTRTDLVLVDFMMPDVNGLDLIRRLSIDSGLARIPVIMITGSGERELVQISLRAGAVDFVLKPWDRGTLMTKVRRALNHGNACSAVVQTAPGSSR